MVGPNEKLRVLRRLPEVVFDEEMHGYNKHQVDKVLDRLAPLADEVDALVDRLNEAERRAAAAEARLIEQGGPAPTPDAVAEAAPAPAPVAEAAPVAPANFDETLSKTLLLAQRTADATVDEANEDASRLRLEAQAEVASLRDQVAAENAKLRADAESAVADARRSAESDVVHLVDAARADLQQKVAVAEADLAEAHESTRADLIAQITELRQSRDLLSADLEQFEGHLATRRETIREALVELSSVVDDPDRLRTTMPPEPADITEHNPADYGSISVDVPAVDALAVDLDHTEAIASPVAVDAADQADDGGADATEAVPVLDLDQAEAEATSSDGGARPAWADAVPAADPVDGEPEAGDPFLDELRRVTTEDTEEDEALANFLSEDDTESGGWFGRRR